MIIQQDLSLIEPKIVEHEKVVNGSIRVCGIECEPSVCRLNTGIVIVKR